MRGIIKKAICGIGRVAFAARKKRLPKRINRILFFKVGAIGDVIMTTPLVRALKKRFPQAKIDYLVGKWSAPVLEKNPNLSNVITFDDNIFFKRNIGRMLSLAKDVRRRKYDVVFILDRAWQANVYAKLLGSFTIGFDRHGEGFANNASAGYDDLRHDVVHYLALGRILSAKTNNTEMEVYFTKKEEGFADTFWKTHGLHGQKVLGIMPGGGSNPGQIVSLKRWPVKRFRELSEKLLKKGHYLIILGGPGDITLSKEFDGLDKHKAINIIGKCSLMESGALMKRCETVFTNDSGPMHLAAAAGSRVISIFGPTDPVKLAPLGKKHVCLHSKLPCQPCYHDGDFADCNDHACMMDITVDEVMKYVK